MQARVYLARELRGLPTGETLSEQTGVLICVWSEKTVGRDKENSWALFEIPAN